MKKWEYKEALKVSEAETQRQCELIRSYVERIKAFKEKEGNIQKYEKEINDLKETIDNQHNIIEKGKIRLDVMKAIFKLFADA